MGSGHADDQLGQSAFQRSAGQHIQLPPDREWSVAWLEANAQRCRRRCADAGKIPPCALHDEWKPELECLSVTRRLCLRGRRRRTLQPSRSPPRIEKGPPLLGRPFDMSLTPSGAGGSYLETLETTPAPTVRPPSRIAKRRPWSMAIGAISSTSIFTLSPGRTISLSAGSFTTPVTSVVRK